METHATHVTHFARGFVTLQQTCSQSRLHKYVIELPMGDDAEANAVSKTQATKTLTESRHSDSGEHHVNIGDPTSGSCGDRGNTGNFEYGTPDIIQEKQEKIRLGCKRAKHLGTIAVVPSAQEVRVQLLDHRGPSGTGLGADRRHVRVGLTTVDPLSKLELNSRCLQDGLPCVDVLVLRRWEIDVPRATCECPVTSASDVDCERHVHSTRCDQTKACSLCRGSSIALCHGSVAAFDINAQLLGLVIQNVKYSSVFSKNVLAYMLDAASLFHHQQPPLVILLPTCTDKVAIDYKWYLRVNDLLHKKVMLDDAMNWLNTLGGGFSALGDHSDHHSEQAGLVAMRQFKVAMEMGDQPTLIRCHLYVSLSLMQRGHLARARETIRRQYSEVKGLPIEDPRLVATCKGLWTRLQYCFQQARNRSHTTRNKILLTD